MVAEWFDSTPSSSSKKHTMKGRIVSINTTAFEEENFLILTTLLDSQIKEVIEPIVIAEREKGEWYDNDVLINALSDAYPRYVVRSCEIESLSI